VRAWGEAGRGHCCSCDVELQLQLRRGRNKWESSGRVGMERHFANMKGRSVCFLYALYNLFVYATSISRRVFRGKPVFLVDPGLRNISLCELS
jgi:hypothetical protein